MRIKTQFVLSMVLFGLTLSIITASVMGTSRQVSRLDGQEEIAAAVGRGASELDFLASDYILYREPQQRDRWEAKWAEVSRDAARLDPTTTEERSVARNIGVGIERFGEAFEEVVRASRTSTDTLGPVLSSRIAVQSQGLVSDALRLSRVLDGEKTALRRRNSQLILALLVVFAAYLGTNYIIVYRRALSSLADVQTGTEIIGRGDLDHTIPVKRDDEIGDLSRAFNKMAADLKGITASKSQLEEEVAEREAAEEALQESIYQVEELSEERRKELATTKRLLETSEAIARLTDVRELARRLADVLLKITSHSRAIVMGWDEERQEVEVLACEGVVPLAVGTKWPIDQVSAPARSAVIEGRTAIWDLDELPEEDRGAFAPANRAMHVLCVPLVQRGAVVGLVALDDPGDRCDFTPREIELVQGVAAQAAVAFENARLFEAQRRIADRLQEALLVLPEALPGIDFAHAYHSATEAMRVGGDFYDLFEIEHDLLGITIGDVAGKGLDAAVLTSLVKNVIRAHAHAGDGEPGAILSLTNDVVHKSTPTEAFATVFFGILDISSGRLSYSNAGHTTVAVVEKGESLRRLTPTGPLLGAFPEVPFGQSEVSLDLEDVLFLYTDGLIEARHAGEQYGEDALFAWLSRSRGRSVDDIVRGVIGEVKAFSDNHLRDDVAILALTRSASRP